MTDASLTVMRAPSVVEFFGRIVADVGNGFSVLCLMQRHAYAPLFQAHLVEQILALDRRSEVVNLAQLGNDPVDPLAVLTDALTLPAPDSPVYSPERFLAEARLPDVLIVVGLDGAADKQRWLRFFDEWASAAHMVASTRARSPSCLVGVLTPDEHEWVPPAETRLRRYWWWAVPSALEIALVCRLRSAQAAGRIDARELWREAVLPGVVGNDLAMLDCLWDEAYGSFARLLECLQEHARERGWSREALRRWGVDDFARRRGVAKLPEQLDVIGRRLWVQGVLDYIPEFGPWLSSAALATLGDEDVIRHRLWHGQAGLVLPLLDRLRLDVYRRIGERHGGVWQLRKRPVPNVVRETGDGDLPPEWPDLRRELYDSGDAQLRALLPRVDLGRRVRNTLAHYTPINYHDYEQLVGYLG